MIDTSLRDRRIALNNQITSAQGQVARLEAERDAAFEAFKDVETDYLRAQRAYKTAAAAVADKWDAVFALQDDLKRIEGVIAAACKAQAP